MTSGLTLSKSTDCAGSVPRPVGARTARRVMTAHAAVTGNVLNAAVPNVDSARVRFSHIGERPHSKHLLVRTSDGVSLAVYDTGSRSAEHTVVFLHGLCLNQTSWNPQITYLLRRYGRSVRIISYDHRGHGRSAAAPMNTYRIDQLADDLAQVLTALDVTGPLTFVGHSMGGMTALAYLGPPPAQRPAQTPSASRASIHARKLVIGAGAPPLPPPSHAADMTAAIRGAEHVHVPGAGHMLPQQAPQVINEAIRRAIAVRSSSDAMSPRRL